MSSTSSADQVTQAAQIIKNAREMQQMTLRDFSAALGVSHNAVAMWETAEREISTDRLQAWLNDSRDWVRLLGVKLFALKYGPMLANVAANQPPAVPPAPEAA